MCNETSGRYTSSMKKRLRYAEAVPANLPSVTGESDADVAGRVRGGDRDAEAELFRRLAPRVRLYGLRHLRDAAAADDLAQDVMLLTFDSLRAGKVRESERWRRSCWAPVAAW
jgi:RNA polymerase sigma-70 factor (ECF subfamily)